MSIMEYEDIKKPKNLQGGNKYLPRAGMIKGIFSSERNRSGQFYLQNDLKGNGHYTSRTKTLFDEMYDQTFSSSTGVDGQSTMITRVPYCHVPRDSNYCNSDKSVIVINKDQFSYADIGLGSDVPFPITKATSIVTTIFEKGIEYYFEYDIKKRVAVSTSDSDDDSVEVENPKIRDPGGNLVTANVRADSLPQVNIGWTHLDCNAYADNPATVAGNVKPALKSGGVPPGIHQHIIEIVELALRLFPKDHAFNPSNLPDSQGRRYREKMFKEFKEFLGGDSDVTHFRVEGITLLIPVSIGWHRDILNDTREGFRSVISINVDVPMNKATMPLGFDSFFGTWLKKNGYSKSFPCSLILYSREVVGGHCEKLAQSDIVSEDCIIRKLVRFGLVDRAGEVEDYKSQLFNNNLFPDVFMKMAKLPKKEQRGNFKGLMWQRTACYDRIVSCDFFYFDLSLLLSSINILNDAQALLASLVFFYLDIHINLISMDVRSAIEYCCFACFVNQGTSGIAEIHRQCMKDREYYQHIFIENEMNFYDFLRDRWMEFMPDKTVGACFGKRFDFPNCKTDWSKLSDKIFDVLMKFHEEDNITSSKLKMDKILAEVCHILRTEKKGKGKKKMVYPGAGPFTTVLFIQLASLLGLIPLYCFHHADIVKPSLGPGSLIRIGEKNDKLNGKQCNEIFRSVQSQFMKIWGSVVTLALIENMCCELYRSFGATLDTYQKKNKGRQSPEPGLEIVLDDKYRQPSSGKDIFYHDEARGCVQNLFLVRQSGKGECELRPMLLMKHSVRTMNGDPNKAIIKLTNWVQNSKDPMNLFWEHPPEKLKIDSSLRTSVELRRMMRLDEK